MNIASVFDWFARESLRAAEQTEDPRQNVILLKLAVLWGGRRTTEPRRSIAAIDSAEYGRTRSFRRRPRCMSSAEKSCSDFRLPCGGMTSGRRSRRMKGSLRATGSPLIL